MASFGWKEENRFLIISDLEDQSRFITQDEFLDDFATRTGLSKEVEQPRDVLTSFDIVSFDGSSKKRRCR